MPREADCILEGGPFLRGLGERRKKFWFPDLFHSGARENTTSLLWAIPRVGKHIRLCQQGAVSQIQMRQILLAKRRELFDGQVLRKRKGLRGVFAGLKRLKIHVSFLLGKIKP